MPRKVTQQDFVIRSNKAHNNKYDYSLSLYVGGHTKVKIICPEHGLFEQKPNDHMRGIGCKVCKGYINTEQFIEKANIVHSGKYDYSLVVYKNMPSKVRIICLTHGVFEQSAHNHLKGQGCVKCGNLMKHGHKRDKYISACEKKHNGRSKLYLIKCFNKSEVFYKVGITTKANLKLRFSGVHMPYQWKQLRLISGNASYIWDLESSIQLLIKGFAYKPRILFHGHTECFSEVPKEIYKLLDSIDKSDQLQLIA